MLGSRTFILIEIPLSIFVEFIKLINCVTVCIIFIRKLKYFYTNNTKESLQGQDCFDITFNAYGQPSKLWPALKSTVYCWM